MEKKINFKKFKMFTDISQENTIECDVRKELADALYKNMNGIVAHDLALRIYRSDDEMPISGDDEKILREFLMGARPVFIDSFENNLK